MDLNDERGRVGGFDVLMIVLTLFLLFGISLMIAV